MATFIGIDLGTSACRACAINEQAQLIAEARTRLPAPVREASRVEQGADVWWRCLTETLDELCRNLDATQIRRIAIDGTSATLLLCDKQGHPLTPGLMYNDARAQQEAEQIRRLAPADSAAQGASSSLAKLLHLSRTVAQTGYLAGHQADWLTGKFTGRFGISDENNALKMGYDPVQRCWPHWLAELELDSACVPTVVPAGSFIGKADKAVTGRWNWPDDVEVVAGTTDSTAGFIATGADKRGTAVTALGSTLVLKVLSDQPVFAARYGVYSHRLGDRWLVGGASNAGGAVLRQFFSQEQIDRYTELIQPETPTATDYYPLPAPGERFPIQDPRCYHNKNTSRPDRRYYWGTPV